MRRENLSAKVAADLRREILEGRHQPGDQLPGHRELAAELGVGVSSVREAISMLVSAGLIETRAGRGTFVTAGDGSAVGDVQGRPLDRREIQELTEARELLELQIVGLAAERATSESIARLRAAVDKMRAAPRNASEYSKADIEFHLALAEACGNRYLLRSIVNIRTLLERDLELSADAAIRRVGDLEFSIADHVAVVDAVEAGDPEAARRVLFDIMSRHHHFVLGIYEPSPAETRRLADAAGAAPEPPADPPAAAGEAGA